MRLAPIILAALLLLPCAGALKVLKPHGDELVVKCDGDLDNLTVYVDGEPVSTLERPPCDNETKTIVVPFTPTGGSYRLLVHGYQAGKLEKSERVVEAAGLKEKVLEFFSLHDSLFIASVILTILFSAYFFSLRFVAAPATDTKLRLEDEFTGALTHHLPPGMPEPPEPEAAMPPAPTASRKQQGPKAAEASILADLPTSDFKFSDPDSGAVKSPPEMGGGFIFHDPAVSVGKEKPSSAEGKSSGEAIKPVHHTPGQAGAEPHPGFHMTPDDEAALPMDKQLEFDRFVTASLKAGHMLGHIRASLIKTGWPADLVDRELKVYFKSGLFK